MEVILSNQNKFVKEVSNIFKNNDDDKYIIEGKKFVFDITKKEDILYYCISESFFSNNESLFSDIDEKYIKVFSDSIFKKVSDTQSSQGILCVLKKKDINIEEAFKRAESLKLNVILILDNLQDPGNFGTIIRTFEAVGGSLIFATKGTVSAYNSKCVRSSAGLTPILDIVSNMEKEEIFKSVKEHGYEIIGTHLDGKKTHFEVDFSKKIAIVIGNEGNGMSDYFTNNSDTLIKIPIIGTSESLNASVSASVVLYEALRQQFL